MSATFIYNPQRDASNVFKGFYYQVQLTVLRWLNLQEGTVLFCECGEDIDHVRQLFDSDRATQQRVLEQVKLRDRITLHSPEAIKALVRFCEAITNNPTLQIFYCFSTTATPGREKRIRFPRDLQGIDAWNAVNSDELTEHESLEFVAQLKGLVREASCPQDLPQRIFGQLQDYLNSRDLHRLLEEFVRRFEWATGLPDPPQLGALIQSSLLEHSRAHNQQEARLLSEILTVHVFKLLTQQGEKRLTLHELEHVLREKSITELDRRILTRIERFVEQAQAYFQRTSIQLGSIALGVAALQSLPEQLSQLTNQLSDVQSQLLPMQLPPPDEPPLPPPIYTKRTKLRQTLCEQLSSVTWLAITGATGMGKTIAARLIADMHGLDRTIWISLRGEQDRGGVLHRLDLHLLRVASTPDGFQLVERYSTGRMAFSELVSHVASRLGAEGLLLLDEIPDLLVIPGLDERLVTLVTGLKQNGARLLTTSQREISSFVRHRVLAPMAETAIPPMTNDDIEEMILAAGAPAPFRQPGFLGLIQAATHGHPSLISATITFLRHNEWKVGQDQLLATLMGEPAKEVKAQTRRKVFMLLAKDNLHELLYRLSLIGTPFDSSLVNIVGAVEPPVPRPAEHLPELIGPWVERLADGRFQVSPLLHNAGMDALDPRTQQRVHLAIALWHVKGRTIGYEEAFQIFIHLLAAKDWIRITDFLLKLSVQLREYSHAELFTFIGLLFPSTWPDDMPLKLRIVFRAAQIRILTPAQENVQDLTRDLDTMIEEAQGTDLLSAFIALLVTGPMNPASSAGMLARRVLRARRIFGRLPVEMQDVPVDVPLESLIWFAVPKIETAEDAKDILSVLRQMSEDERRAAFAHSVLGYDGPQAFANRCWLLEFKKPEVQRNWNAVMALLDEITLLAGLPGGEQLRAPAAAAKAVVLGDHMDRPQEALAVIEGALPTADSNGRFLLLYTAGCILLDHSTPEASSEAYQRALSESPSAYRFLQFDALRRACEAAGRAGQWMVARERAVRSIKVSRGDELTYERLEMIGELAWAYWALGHRRKACAAMSGLARGLIQREDHQNPRFREVFRKAGHALGWMESVAETGKPPVPNSQGERYVEPFPGSFSRARPQLADIPLPLPPHALLYELGRLADGCALHVLAWRRLNEAKELAGSKGLRVFQRVVDLDLAELAARREEYEDALQLTLSGIRSFGAIQRLKEQGTSFLTADSSIDDFWTGLSIERRQDAERMAYWTTIGPAITRLLAKDGSPQKCADLFQRLAAVFLEHQHEFADFQYWTNMLRELRVAFSSTATRETIRDQIQGARVDQVQLLHLAFSRTPQAGLAESCGAHSVAFEALFRTLRLSKLMCEDVAIYVLRYWREVAGTQAFALRNPRGFKTALASLQQPTISNAAKVLLLAVEATGARLAETLRQGLIDATKFGDS